MAETAAASTLNIIHDGQFYRSDKQTAELLRQVQHWQGDDRALETALFDHGLKTGRIQPGDVAPEQVEEAFRAPLTIETPAQLSRADRLAQLSAEERAVPQDMSHLQEHYEELLDIAGKDMAWHLREPSPESQARMDASEAAYLERVYQDNLADEQRHVMPAGAQTIPYELLNKGEGWDRLVHATLPDGSREAMTVSDHFDLEQSGKPTVAEAREWMRTPVASEHSWLTRAAVTARNILQRVDRVVERWLPSPADTHFQQGATIAFRDQSTNTTRMAHVTEARDTRALDVKGWLPTQVVTIRQEDANGLTSRRELTPRELRSATLLQSSSSSQTTGVPQGRENDARNQPVRQAVDPPLRQPGSAWNTTVQQSWPTATARDRAPAEQRATIAWPVNQPAPLAFRATQRRGLEQGQG